MKYFLLILFLLAGCRNSVDDMDRVMEIKHKCQETYVGTFQENISIGPEGIKITTYKCYIGNLVFELNPNDVRK